MSVKTFRHELKYYIGQAEYELISRKLALTMDRDRFALRSGKYFIRSLYFDDYENSALQEKLDGTDSRRKYRIRSYNLKDTGVKLECKRKEGPYVQKSVLKVSRAECDALISGNFGFLLSRSEPFAHEMYAIFRMRNLKPRVIVEYWREAYVFPVEDVRVTFDQDIRTGFRATSLFDPTLPTYPVLDEYGMVLEIKFNKYLPGHIRALVQPVQNAQRSAISKYCLCRKYE